MNKALYYFKTEYNHEEHDLYQLYGEDYSHLKYCLEKKELLDPADEVLEKEMKCIIDAFMHEKFQENKKRRRAY